MLFARRAVAASVPWLSFALVAAVVVAGAVVVVVHAPRPVVERILQEEKTEESLLWIDRVLFQIADPGRAFGTGDLALEETARLSRIPTASDVSKLVLFDRTGRVIWSSEDGEIGEEADGAVFRRLREARAPVYIREAMAADALPHLELHSLSGRTLTVREIAEIYVPVVDDGRLLGALELYMDVTDELTLYVGRVRLVLALLVTLGVLLVLVPLGLSLRHSALNARRAAAEAEAERARAAKQLRLAQEVQLLGELNEWLQSSRSLDELFMMVRRFLERMLPDSEGSFYIYSNSRDVLDGVVAWGGGAAHQHIRPADCWALRRGRAYRYGFGTVDFPCEHVTTGDGRPSYCFPILARGETVGLMHMMLQPAGDPSGFERSFDLARMLAEQVALAIANVRLRDELHEQSLRDPLTGLYNRRHLSESLRTLLLRPQTPEGSLAVVSIDVDHFKRFNDDHGHDAGDTVLRAVGAALKESCVGEDIACRNGGEEFMLLWPDQTAESAGRRAEELRARLERLPVHYAGHLLPQPTVSIGLALAAEHGTAPLELMRLADEALYAAKQAGRNRVMPARTASPPAPVSLAAG